MRVSHTAALVFLLAISSAAPAAFAAPSRTTAHAVPQRAAERAAVPGLRGWLVRLWSADGCRIDPLGRCSQGSSATPPRTLTVDEGCGMDPLGCRAAQR
jgi:hypothetical protein